MGSFFPRLFGRDRVEDRSLTRESLPVSVFGEPMVVGSVGERAAMQLLDVFSCVRVIVEACSALPLVAYRRVEHGRERIKGGRLVSLLDQPAPAVTQQALVGQMVTSLATRGNVFVGKYRRGEQIEQLGVLPTDAVQVEIKAGQPVYTYTHPVSGKVSTLGPEDVVHIRLPVSTDGVLGLSPIAQCREALSLNRSLTTEAAAAVENGLGVSGVLSVKPGPGSDDLLEGLKEGMESRHRGSKNRGRVAVISGEIDFSGMSLSPHDAQFIEQMQLSTVGIARLIRVPPWCIGAKSGDSLTYATVAQQLRALQNYCLQTYLIAIEQAFTQDADLCPGPTTYVQFVREAALQQDHLERAQFYALALDGERGWMSRREVREREDLPPEATEPPPVLVPSNGHGELANLEAA